MSRLRCSYLMGPLWTLMGSALMGRTALGPLLDLSLWALVGPFPCKSQAPIAILCRLASQNHRLTLKACNFCCIWGRPYY